MTNPTTVDLYVPASMRELVLPLLDNDTVDEETNDGELCAFTYHNVNYGQLDFLPKLIEAGIPFDSSWQPGDDFGAGTRHCRFNDQGELVIRELYDSDANPDINELLKYLGNYKRLKKYIEVHFERRVVLPWTNQEQYGKLYRTYQLISA